MGIPASQQIKRIKIPLTNPLIAQPIMNDKDNSRLESGVIKSSGSVWSNFICNIEEAEFATALVITFIINNPGKIYILYETPPISLILFSRATPKTNMYNSVVTIPGIIVCLHTEKNRMISLEERV